MTNAVNLTRLTAAIRAGRITEALDVLMLTEASYSVLLEAVRAAYIDSGRATLLALTSVIGREGYKIAIRFDARNPQAESWLQNYSSRLVTEIVEEQRESVRTVLQQGMREGVNPRTTALNITGRMEAGSNQRSGGVLGLTSQQTGWVSNARAELESGDTAQLRRYLNREKRDKRFDATIKAAIKNGTPIPQDKIDQIIGRYSDRLLALRGETIARTESLQSLTAGQHESYRQAIARGEIPAAAITKRWKTAFDPRVRLSHGVLHNKEVPFSEPFTTLLGSRLFHPGDTSLGARAGDIVNCRCVCEYRIDYLKAAGRR